MRCAFALPWKRGLNADPIRFSLCAMYIYVYAIFFPLKKIERKNIYEKKKKVESFNSEGVDSISCA